MATNKHATIRYHALDQCFRNTRRKYFIEDLIECCNNAIFEYTSIEEGVKRRQIFDDIKFMESDQGWAIPLERIKDGKRVYYRYEDPSFSIKKQPLSEVEAVQLKESLMLLSRFKGMPQFEWIEEIVVRLESAFNLTKQSSEIVGFEQNRYLKGLDFFSQVFNAILYKQVLHVRYKSFKNQDTTQFIFHPYYLKQYNNRWFLFGLNQHINIISNLALDRIEQLQEIDASFIENSIINFEEYFEDMIGVSSKPEQLPEKVVVKIDNNLWPYLETKPLHGSQKIISRTADYVTLELSVIVNYELISLLFSMGEELTVMEPAYVSEQIRTKALAVLKKYY
jgi:predicted DNA-binding transcriptional regulator YafY